MFARKVMEQDVHTTASNPLVAAATQGVEVRFDGVVKDFGAQRVLHELDLTVHPGEFLSLLGPSGCGKTTALRLLAGLEQLSGGAICIGGQDVSAVPTNKRDLGMVFQAYSLFPHMNALQNTMFGLAMRNVSKEQARRRAEAALDLVGLPEFGERFPTQLSGGQQQRVALARALVTEPRVLLLDEPLSALDAKVRTQLREEIRRIQLRLGITTIFVTHDQEEALAISDRVAVMNAGHIEQVDTPEELYLRPASGVVADFVGVSSVVPGVIAAGEVTVWGQRIPLVSAAPEGDASVYIRPENVAFVGENDPAAVAATVQESVFLGSMRRTRVRTEDGVQLRIQHAVSEAVEYGDRVWVRVRPVPVAVQV